jgi:AcrR family transcriptional regulator
VESRTNNWNNYKTTERLSSGKGGGMPEPSSTLRQRKAQLTRDEILGAARRLFAERGYTRTSVRDIAQAAGVSAQTVYDSIGSKQAVVAQLNDLLDSEAGIAAIAATVPHVQDSSELAATSARICRAILEHCSDIVHALVSGAASEPALAAALEEGQRRHLGGTRMIVGRLAELDALAPDVDVDAAVATLAALSDVRFSLILQDSYGWTPDQIESWVADASCALLLGAPAVNPD